MGAAFPVISAGVGVAGGIVSMFERNAEERRQRQLIQAQLQANQTAQEAQIAAIMTGRTMDFNNYMTENMGRQMQFQSAVQNHNTAAMQNTAQAMQLNTQLNVKQQGLQNQANAGDSQLFAKEEQYRTQANQARMAGLGEQTQVSEAATRAFAELQQALREGNTGYAAMLSNMLANEMGPQVSEATEARAGQMAQQEMQAMLQTFSDAENLNEQALQRAVLSDEFAQLLEDIGLYEGTAGRSEINYALGSMINEINANRNIGNIQYQTMADAIAKSLQMQPGLFEIDQLQGDMNFGARMAQTTGQAAGLAAQNIQQQAQLLRQMPQQQSVLGGILSTASAAMPLGSLFFGGGTGILSQRAERPLVQLDRPVIPMPDVRLDREVIPMPNIRLDRPLY